MTTSTFTTSTFTTTSSTGAEIPGTRNLSTETVPSAATQVWLYSRAFPGCWTVGYFDPTGQWQFESDDLNAEDAARRVRWLNGGDHDLARHDAACVAARDRAEAELDRLEAAVKRLSATATRWKLQARRRARRFRELQRRTARR